jgi:hypothetical protein
MITVTFLYLNYDTTSDTPELVYGYLWILSTIFPRSFGWNYPASKHSAIQPLYQSKTCLARFAPGAFLLTLLVLAVFLKSARLDSCFIEFSMKFPVGTCFVEPGIVYN